MVNMYKLKFFIELRNYILGQWEVILEIPDLSKEVKEEYTEVIHKIIKELEQKERNS